MSICGALRSFGWLALEAAVALSPKSKERPPLPIRDYCPDCEAQADCGLGAPQFPPGWEVEGFTDHHSSAAPGDSAPDAAAERPAAGPPLRRGAPTSTVVDPFTWATVDGPEVGTPGPDSGPPNNTDPSK